MMKLLVFGSRDFNDIVFADEKLRHIKNVIEDEGDIVEIISGGAIGADTIAEKFANAYELEKHIYTPKYDKYDGNVAPLMRNIEMVKDCDEAVCFWDGVSSGTLFTIKELAKAGKSVTVYGYKK
jgi:hypothetical protein